MGQLTAYLNTVQKDKTREFAGQLIGTVKTLKEQYITIKGEIVSLKEKIKTDVANDIWNKADIKSLSDKVELMDGIKTKGLRYKQSLSDMKNAIEDPTEKTELQTEIDNLKLNGN